MKKITVLILATFLLLSSLASVFAIQDTVTIKAGVNAKGGTYATKRNDETSPALRLDDMNTGGRKLYFWVWKKNFRQVTPTYTLSGTGDRTIYYMTGSGYIVNGDQYRAVWKKVSGKNISQSVDYEFIP